MLLNKFYTLVRQETEGGKVNAVVSFNPTHPIFDGHFPGHPVVPGVCMIQIVREVLEVEIGQKLKISFGDNLKFLSIINPQEHREVEVIIAFSGDHELQVSATIQTGSTTFFKFKGTLQKV